MTKSKRIILYPYKMGSKSAKALQQELRSRGHKVLRVFPDRKYRPRETDTIVNWGSTKTPTWSAKIKNPTTSISGSIDKVTTFKKLAERGVSTPEFTTDINVAKTWEGKIFARTLTNSCSGKGIVVCDKNTLVPAPLYTKFIDKDSEYRVHIFIGEVIDYAKKVPMGEKHDVCSHDNGYLFIRKVKHLDENIELAKMAISALGLDFGAVDIIRKDKKSYILEINTACGMEETTRLAYTNAIEKCLQETI